MLRTLLSTRILFNMKCQCPLYRKDEILMILMEKSTAAAAENDSCTIYSCINGCFLSAGVGHHVF